MKIFTLFILLLTLTACSSTKITKEGMTVRVIKNPEFVEKCKFIGAIEESNYSGWGEKDNKSQALNAARNTAGKMGGDTITIASELYRGVQVDIYKCNQ